MACYADPFPTFQPAKRLITSITQSNPVTVTTSFHHDYITGEIVRFFIPLEYGMSQINRKFGTVSVVDATTFTVDIDTSLYEAFVVPAVPVQCPQIVPIGEINSMLSAATKNVLPTGVR